MKFLQNAVAGEPLPLDSGRTVLVGVKLDSHSRELLTWALVKVAQPGDLVVALHVLGNDGELSFCVSGFGFLMWVEGIF